MTYTDLIFLFVLFPLSAIVSLLDRSAEFKNLILLVTSLLFFSWGRPFAVCLIFVSVIVDWLLGFAAGGLREKTRCVGLIPVIVSGVMNTALIFYYNSKLLPDLIGTSQNSSSPETVIINIGIAFYALKGFSYVYDVYKNKIHPEKNVFCLMTYMMSYCMLIVGPVVRYGDAESQIRRRDVTTEKLNAGLNNIFWGLGKVVLLADLFGRIKLAGLNSAEITTLGCWLGMIAFVMQYYFLFTGLCDMSRGLCLIYGFVFPVNYQDSEANELFTGAFESYNSTVTSFFRDMFGLIKGGEVSYAAARAALCGAALCAWYTLKDKGSVGYIAAGVTVCLVILLERVVLKKALGRLPAAVKYLYTMFISMLVFGAVYFDGADSFGGWFYGYRKWIGGLFGINTDHFVSAPVNSLIIKNITLIVISFFIICPHAKRAVLRITEDTALKSRRSYGSMRSFKTICTALIFLLSAMTLVVETAG